MKTNSSGRRPKSRPIGGLPARTVAVFAVVAMVCMGCGGTIAPHARPGVGGSSSMPTPIDFVFESLDDRPVSAEATRGQPTILAFVTTGNLAAQAQVDFLVAMAKNDGKRVHYGVVALEEHGSRELVELYRKALSIPFPVAMADRDTLAGVGAFGDVRPVPVTVILDRVGRVVWRVEGRVTKSEELRAAMRGL